jgi:hypothetical protein
MFVKEYFCGILSLALLTCGAGALYFFAEILAFEYYYPAILVPAVFSLLGLALSLFGVVSIKSQNFIAYVAIVLGASSLLLIAPALFWDSHPFHIKRVNEDKVVQELWRLQKAQELYLDTCSASIMGMRDYAADFEELQKFGLIDAELASGVKHGYKFEITAWARGMGIPAWSGKASPLEPGTTGDRHFRTGENQHIQQSGEDIFRLRFKGN